VTRTRGIIYTRRRKGKRHFTNKPVLHTTLTLNVKLYGILKQGTDERLNRLIISPISIMKFLKLIPFNMQHTHGPENNSVFCMLMDFVSPGNELTDESWKEKLKHMKTEVIESLCLALTCIHSCDDDDYCSQSKFSLWVL